MGLVASIAAYERNDLIKTSSDDTTLAEKFLQDNSDEQLLQISDLADAALLIFVPEVNFSDASQITSSGLYNFYLAAGENFKQWQNNEDEKFYFPVKEITKTLDEYFEDYIFRPSEVYFTDYDDKKDVLIAPSVCRFGTGCIFPEIGKKEAISNDIVVFETIYYDRCDDINSTNVLGRRELTLKITSNGYKFISSRRI